MYETLLSVTCLTFSIMTMLVTPVVMVTSARLLIFCPYTLTRGPGTIKYGIERHSGAAAP